MLGNIQNSSEKDFSASSSKTFGLIDKTCYVSIVCYLAMPHVGQMEKKNVH
jgi:hypothetical protein